MAINNDAAEKKKQAQPRRIGRSGWLPLLVGGGAGVFYLLVGFSIHLSPVRPIDRLTEARVKWEATGITNYRMKVRFPVLTGIWITVRNGQVTQIEDAPVLCGKENDDCMTYDPAKATPVAPDADWYTATTSYFNLSESYLPRLDDYNMSGIFEFAADKIKDEPAPPLISWCGHEGGDVRQNRYQANYDESQGYIKNLRLSNCIEWQFGGGLMCGVISHCQSGFNIESLEPLPENTP